MRLDVKDLSCGYKDQEPIQRNVTFNVSSGEVCCVLGANGCGKTTLFKTILGLLPPKAGSITIDGEDVTKWNAKRLAEVVAYASQNHVPPFPYRVKDVVLLGRVSDLNFSQPKEQDYHIVDNAMHDMGIYDLRERPYTEISGGQLQLVMIARALAQQPQLLVLDEPTAALDYGNAVRVIEKVRWLAARGYAVIMTTHSPDHAFMCKSNVLLLQTGKPMIFGKSEEVIIERSMRDAYGVNVRVVEFVNKSGEVMRMCSPEFASTEELERQAQASREEHEENAGHENRADQTAKLEPQPKTPANTDWPAANMQMQQQTKGPRC